MVQCITVFCAAVTIISWKKLKNPLNPLTAMFALWAVWVPLSNAGLYQMSLPSEKVFQIILCGLIFYLSGCIIGMRLPKKKIAAELPPQILPQGKDAVKVSYLLLYILGAVALAFYFYQFSKVMRLMLTGHSIAYIRDLVFSKEENEMRSSGLIVILNNFIVTPTTYFMTAYLPVEIFKGRKDKLLITETVLMLALWIMTTGGRTVLFFVGVAFAFVFFKENNSDPTLWNKIKKAVSRKILGKKNILLMILGGGVLGGVLFGITIARKGNDIEELLRQFYVYFGAPPRLLDYYVDIIDKKQSDLYGYGMSSFYGFVYPFMFLLRLFGFNYPEHMLTIHEWSVTKLQDSVWLGGRIHINAFVTIFFQPYLDGRFVGVAIVLFIFGFAAGLFYSKSVKQNNIRYMVAYLLMLHKIIFSMGRFWFTQPGQAISMILVFLIISKHAQTVRVKK